MTGQEVRRPGEWAACSLVAAHTRDRASRWVGADAPTQRPPYEDRTPWRHHSRADASACISPGEGGEDIDFATGAVQLNEGSMTCEGPDVIWPGPAMVLRHTWPSRGRITHPIGSWTDALRRRLTELRTTGRR